MVTHMAIGNSPEGFDAEWRVIDVVIFEGDRISRTELFDESDLAEALACFEAIQASARRPGNAASRLYERFKSYYAARDLQAIGEMFADNVCTEDRRRVVNAGLLQGKDAVLEEISALAELERRPDDRCDRDARDAPRPQPRPSLWLRPRIRWILRRSVSTSSNSTPTAGPWRASCSTWTTVPRRSKNLMPDSSQAKQPLTQLRGR